VDGGIGLDTQEGVDARLSLRFLSVHSAKIRDGIILIMSGGWQRHRDGHQRPRECSDYKGHCLCASKADKPQSVNSGAGAVHGPAGAAGYLNDAAFQSAAFQSLVHRIYVEIRKEGDR